MRNEWVRRNKWIYVVAPLAGVAFVAACGEVVMHLWNWLVPGLIGWHAIKRVAGTGAAVVEPDTLWKLERRWEWAVAKAREVGAHEPGRPGEVSHRDACAVRGVWGQGGEGDGVGKVKRMLGVVSMNPVWADLSRVW